MGRVRVRGRNRVRVRVRLSSSVAGTSTVCVSVGAAAADEADEEDEPQQPIAAEVTAEATLSFLPPTTWPTVAASERPATPRSDHARFSSGVIAFARDWAPPTVAVACVRVGSVVSGGW